MLTTSLRGVFRWREEAAEQDESVPKKRRDAKVECLGLALPHGAKSDPEQLLKDVQGARLPPIHL